MPQEVGTMPACGCSSTTFTCSQPATSLSSRTLKSRWSACMQVIVNDFVAFAGMVGDIETTVQVGETVTVLLLLLLLLLCCKAQRARPACKGPVQMHLCGVLHVLCQHGQGCCAVACGILSNACSNLSGVGLMLMIKLSVVMHLIHCGTVLHA